MPKFVKGSQEARDYMASIREKRKIDPVKKLQNDEKLRIQQDKKDAFIREVQVPVFGSETLVMPEFMAVKTKRGYKLVNPLTQERHLSTRNKQPSIRILRKPVKDMVLLEGIDVPIPMILFSKKDRELIDKSFETAEIYASHKIPVNELPTIKLKNVKTRGRPEVLQKNVEYNKLHKKEINYNSEEEMEPPTQKKTKKKSPEIIQQTIKEEPIKDELPKKKSPEIIQQTIKEEPIKEELPKKKSQEIKRQPTNNKLPTKEMKQELFDNWDTPYLSVLLSQVYPEVYENIGQKVATLTDQEKPVIVPILVSFLPFIDELFNYLGSDKTALDVILYGLKDLTTNMNSDADAMLELDNYSTILKYLNAKNKLLAYNIIKQAKDEEKSKEAPKKEEPKKEEPKKEEKSKEEPKKEEKSKEEPSTNNKIIENEKKRKIYDNWDTLQLPTLLGQFYPKVYNDIEKKVMTLTNKKQPVIVLSLIAFIPFLNELFKYLGSNEDAFYIILMGLKRLTTNINPYSDAVLTLDNYNTILKYLNAKNKIKVSNIIKKAIDEEKIYQEKVNEAKSKEAKSKGKGIMNKLKYIKTVFNGRNDYPPKVRNIIEKYGNQEIKSIVIRRNPLQSILNFALNAVSLGGWNKNMEDKPYDTLFHLSIVLTLNNNVRVVLEKNEVINMDTVIRVAPKTETEDIPDIQQGLTLNTLLNNAKNRMGSKYFTYSAKDNNCQDFILAVLQANNIGNEEDYSFVKQDTKSLFENLSTLRKVSNSITDLGAKINEITTGAGLKNNISFDIKMPRRKKCDIADSEGGNILKDMGRALNPRRNGVAKAFRPDGPSEKFGRKLGSVAIHQVLPGVIQETTSALVTGATGNPILGTVVGNTLGQYAGQKAGDALGKAAGMGFSRKARFLKGSAEAREHMSKLRSMRKKKT